MKKRLTALLCSLTLLLTTAFAAENSLPYSDVSPEDWFADAVAEMTAGGYMTGTKENTFSPHAPVTRATVVTVLWRLTGSPEASVETPFPDAVGTWYETAAAWGKALGIATGYSDGTFGGDDLVSREQLATFIHRYGYHMGHPTAQGALGLFDDANTISDWALEPMACAVGMGILQGNSEGLLDPQGTASRASLAVMLRRYLTPAAG